MPLRLILVDDIPELRAVLGQALRLRGNFKIVGEASDGATAIALAGEHQPDLIVLDLGLPDLAGRDVLTGLRAVAPDALVVVYSGSHTSDRPAISNDIEAFVEKSEDVSYVVDLLDEIGNRVPRTATMRLGPDIREVVLARRFVADRCAEWGTTWIADDAAIVVSELVANALVHVRSGCELSVGLRGQVLRIDVVDHGGGMPDLRDATTNDEHGRGLLLVSILCSAWGTEPLDDGKSVWAELHAEPPVSGPRRSRSQRAEGTVGSASSRPRGDALRGAG